MRLHTSIYAHTISQFYLLNVKPVLPFHYLYLISRAYCDHHDLCDNPTTIVLTVGCSIPPTMTNHHNISTMICFIFRHMYVFLILKMSFLCCSCATDIYELDLNSLVPFLDIRYTIALTLVFFLFFFLFLLFWIFSGLVSLLIFRTYPPPRTPILFLLSCCTPLLISTNAPLWIGTFLSHSGHYFSHLTTFLRTYSFPSLSHFIAWTSGCHCKYVCLLHKFHCLALKKPQAGWPL